MEASYFYLSLIIGIVISLLSEEFFGISCGGMIVPGYIALVCDNIPQVILIFAVALLVWFIVNHVLPHFVILFGKRKFVATLIIGLIIKLILDVVFAKVSLPFASIELRGVGAMVPALLAGCFSKQGFRYTVPAVLIASYATFGIISLIAFIF